MEPSVLVPDLEAVKMARGRRSLRLDARELTAIFVGEFVGAVARAELLRAVPDRVGSWPWATSIANVVGAFLLGYFMTRLQERLPVSAYRRPLLGTGLCGGLTTFSTMQIELLRCSTPVVSGWPSAMRWPALTAGFLAVMAATNLVRRARLSG